MDEFIWIYGSNTSQNYSRTERKTTKHKVAIMQIIRQYKYPKNDWMHIRIKKFKKIGKTI